MSEYGKTLTFTFTQEFKHAARMGMIKALGASVFKVEELDKGKSGYDVIDPAFAIHDYDEYVDAFLKDDGYASNSLGGFNGTDGGDNLDALERLVGADLLQSRRHGAPPGEGESGSAA